MSEDTGTPPTEGTGSPGEVTSEDLSHPSGQWYRRKRDGIESFAYPVLSDGWGRPLTYMVICPEEGWRGYVGTSVLEESYKEK